MICVDSYSSSVPADKELWKRGLYFIGFIMIEMRIFQMEYLSNKKLYNWGDISGLLTRPVDSTKTVSGDFIWMDWYRQ